MHLPVDITHPAHVHFLRQAIDLWRGRGGRVSITARRKDIATQLLSGYGLEHLDLGPARSGPKPICASASGALDDPPEQLQA